MSSPAGDVYRHELEERLPILEHRFRGWENNARLPHDQETLELIGRIMNVYKAWITDVKHLLGAMDALDALGYPDMPVMPVSRQIYDDLREERDYQTDALQDITPVEAAVVLDLELGELIPKSSEES